MALNDSWEYTRTRAALDWAVDAVCFATGEAHTRAAFYSRVAAEAYAATDDAGPGWGIAVVEIPTGFVSWTSF